MMQAGRELDALVADKVLDLPVVWAIAPYRETGKLAGEGRQPYLKGHADGVEYDWAEVKRLSTDLAAAWRVVVAMEARGYWCEMRTPFMEPHGNDGYWAGFTPHGTTGWNGTPDHWTSSVSLPLSICLAALKAIEADAEYSHHEAVEELGLPADTTPEQLRQVEQGTLIYRDGVWEMPPNAAFDAAWER